MIELIKTFLHQKKFFKQKSSKSKFNITFLSLKISMCIQYIIKRTIKFKQSKLKTSKYIEKDTFFLIRSLHYLNVMGISAHQKQNIKDEKP